MGQVQVHNLQPRMEMVSFNLLLTSLLYSKSGPSYPKSHIVLVSLLHENMVIFNQWSRSHETSHITWPIRHRAPIVGTQSNSAYISNLRVKIGNLQKALRGQSDFLF